MKKGFAVFVTLTILLMSLAGCAPAASGTTAPADSSAAPSNNGTVAAICTAEQPNFLLVLSDEPNAIGDFAELYVLVTGVGFVLGDEEGIVEETFDEQLWVDLVGLTDELGVALWEGYVPEGDYTKVFLYIDEVWGRLIDSEEVIEIKLPSNKLQLDVPAVVTEDALTEFVFDITVNKAGNSGQYILHPQVSESGQGMAYRLVERTHERVRTERPEFAGRPEWAGPNQGEESGSPDGAPKPDFAGQPEWSPQNADEVPTRPEGAGRPDGAGKTA